MNNPESNFMRLGKHITIFISLLLLTFTGKFMLDNWHYKEGDHRRLQKEINRKFSQTDRIYRRLQDNNWRLNTPVPSDKGITMIAYRNDSLIYWSNNTLSFDRFNTNIVYDKHFDSISNCWYIIKPYLTDSFRAYGLILLKTLYPYENDFLINQFYPDLKLPKSTELLTEPQEGSYSIHDWEGIYLFSVRFSIHELRFARLQKVLIPLFFLLTFVSFLLLIYSAIQKINSRKLKHFMLFCLPVVFLFIRWIQYRFHIPSDIYDLELFGPGAFAKSAWLPSLGDVLINSILIMFCVIEFYLEYTFLDNSKAGRSKNLFRTVAMITCLTGFFLYTQYILSNLILHSTINFDFYNVTSLNTNTLVGVMIAAMHFASILLLSHKMLLECKNHCKLNELILIFILISSVIFSIAYMLDYGFDIGSHLAFIVIFIVLAIMQYLQIQVSSYTTIAFMAIFISGYSVYFFGHFARQKMMNNMRVMAENLANQHDPVAEYLLEDIHAQLVKDETLKRYLFNYIPGVYDERIFNYLQNKYFNGFWGKYKIRFQVCNPYTNITLVENPNQPVVNCYDFYADMVSGDSMRLAQTNFYYLDTLNGKINYMGWLTYERPGTNNEVTFFLELESRLIAEELGYPELLLDKKYQQNKLLNEYSFARYFNNRLLSQSGTFQYSLDLNTYKNKPSKFEGYYHLIHYINNDNVVMVSRPSTSFFNKLVSFSYIFLFYYAILLVFILGRILTRKGKDIEFNFKYKIQLSTFAVLFLSLLLIGGGTIYFSIEQYQKKQYDIMGEKIQSVYIELDRMLAYLPNRISSGWKNTEYDNLNQLLVNFSDVFYSDINLYDPDGVLLATSRPEIFKQGIQGEKMNPTAYNQMVTEKQAEFIHREKIGKLNYLSAYVPFVNAENKLLAFLNLPYFTRQNVLSNDVSTLVVAIVNVYVLLILVTIAMTAFISDQITRPLKLIQQRFSEIKIGKKSQQIIYTGRDEIAGLVQEYNRMVKELAKSVEMLSRSERESAWREMAKQVAHEIKNPLTPMKLSVQHLLRSWEDNRENFDEFLQKVTRTLIEQIDNLSFIASEFSNFAKMPRAFNEDINLVNKIKSTLTLFANTENVDFIFEHESSDIFVFADKEQLSRVFINLIKNAIQSIPDNRHGKVGISLVLHGDMVRISITDNGKGIPEELQNKLFTPSFTTKSSGMGLGLSIVKNIIESFNGNITFNTKVNHGTTFFIDLPVYKKVQPEGDRG
jgi:two-component system, NtrC family, nitrogen regulation sensor histidine kinase NtrY